MQMFTLCSLQHTNTNISELIAASFQGLATPAALVEDLADSLLALSHFCSTWCSSSLNTRYCKCLKHKLAGLNLSRCEQGNEVF